MKHNIIKGTSCFRRSKDNNKELDEATIRLASILGLKINDKSLEKERIFRENVDSSFCI